MVAPASAGPAIRPRLNWAELSAMAGRNSSAGTRSGRMACWNGPITADAEPCTATRPTSTAGLPRPLLTSTASSTAAAAAARLPPISTGRRAIRSASAPPSGASRPMGKNAAAATSTAQVAWPVREISRAPTATACIHEPMLDTSPADHNSA